MKEQSTRFQWEHRPRSRTVLDTYFILDDLLNFQRVRHGKYGHAYNTSFLFQKGIAFASPDAAKEILVDRTEAFSNSLGWERSLGRFFPNGLLLKDFDEHKFHRRLMQEVFKAPAMQSYVDLMAETFAEDIPGWQEQEAFRAFPVVKRLTLRIAAKAFLGVSLADTSEKLTQVFADLLAGSTSVLRVPYLGRTYHRAHLARIFLEDFLRKRIPEKRKEGGRDLFAQLCQARNEEGQYFNDQEVIDHLIFLLLAAHDTLTSSLTHSLFYLAKYPHWQEILRTEAAALPEPFPGVSDLEKWAHTDHFLFEVLRLHPPVPSLPRMALRDVNIAGYLVPAGTVAWVNVLYQHRLPEYWKNGDEFDPERFSDARAEHKQHGFLWIPYGGGAHLCIGKLYSRLQVKLFLKQILSKWEIKLIHKDYQLNLQHVPLVKPRDGLPIILQTCREN